MRQFIKNFIFVVFVAALLSGCGDSDKGPAEAALKAAEEAVNAVKGEASQYLPDQFKSLEDSLAAIKEKFNQGDFKAVLMEAQSLSSKAKEMTEAAAAKKAELTKSWSDLSAGMPKVVAAIKNRVDILSQSKKLPKGMTSDALASAKSGLAEITKGWTAATDASKGGNLFEAVTKASALKPKVVEVLTVLKMPVPQALKG
jgi:hypothetical protein